MAKSRDSDDHYRTIGVVSGRVVYRRRSWFCLARLGKARRDSYPKFRVGASSLYNGPAVQAWRCVCWASTRRVRLLESSLPARCVISRSPGRGSGWLLWEGRVWCLEWSKEREEVEGRNVDVEKEARKPGSQHSPQDNHGGQGLPGTILSATAQSGAMAMFFCACPCRRCHIHMSPRPVDQVGRRDHVRCSAAEAGARPHTGTAAGTTVQTLDDGDRCIVHSTGWGETVRSARNRA